MVIFISAIILIENDILTVDNQLKFDYSFNRKRHKSAKFSLNMRKRGISSAFVTITMDFDLNFTH